MKKHPHRQILHTRSRRRGQVLLAAILLMILAAILGSTFVLIVAHDPVISQTA